MEENPKMDSGRLYTIEPKPCTAFNCSMETLIYSSFPRRMKSSSLIKKGFLILRKRQNRINQRFPEIFSPQFTVEMNNGRVGAFSPRTN